MGMNGGMEREWYSGQLMVLLIVRVVVAYVLCQRVIRLCFH